MRRNGIIAVVIIVFLFAAYTVSCDGGSSLDCQKLCEKTQECDDSTCEDECAKAAGCDSYVDESEAQKCRGECGTGCAFDMQECLDGCENAKDLVQEAFQDEMMSCIEEECANQEACINEAAKACEKPGNFDDFVDALCEKVSECDPRVTVDQCKAFADQAMAQDGAEIANCLTDSAIGTLSDCLGGAVCETFDEDYQKCISEAFGFEASSGSGSSTGGT